MAKPMAFRFSTDNQTPPVEPEQVAQKPKEARKRSPRNPRKLDKDGDNFSGNDGQARNEVKGQRRMRQDDGDVSLFGGSSGNQAKPQRE
jgi:hypothetical protein